MDDNIYIYIYIHEDKRYISLGNLNNELFLHISKTDHNFDFNSAAMSAHIYNKMLYD